MSNDLTIEKNILDGILSRYIKPSCIKGDAISNEAFDLRNGKPPETFVSFFKIENNTDENMFINANYCIKFEKKPAGAIILLDVANVLEEVNDEGEDIIKFFEEKLPHCGLIYLVKDTVKVQEAKTTLSYLAKKRFRLIQNIEHKKDMIITEK